MAILNRISITSAYRIGLLGALLLGALQLNAANFRAGVSRAKITPELRVWLSGYAARTHPADRVRQDLWAKALALDDEKGGRIVIVTTDLIGLPHNLTDDVSARCETRFGLRRSEILFNSSHTHSGPAVWPNLQVLFDMIPENAARSRAYADKLETQLVQIVGESLGNLSPATLSYGEGEVNFAINRRIARLKKEHPSQSFPAPVDHRVVVLRVNSQGGSLRAVLLGYACHNTTLEGNFYEVDGDYAGYAQEKLEQTHPGSQAMFFQLCAGDQNPEPRGTLALAEAHGNELAEAVEKVLAGKTTRLGPPIRTTYETTQLAFAPHTRQSFEREMKSTSVFEVRRAKLMLESYDRGQPVRSIRYPAAVVSFGKKLTILALGGEVVLDYSIRAKREFPDVNLVVAGYSNDVMCYIPSVRILHEGGYEADDSMIYYGQPGPFSDQVEATVFELIHRVMAEAR
jgi:Neutral/alkaline non-lysosomal ceramidase, N-terminal